MSTRNTRPNPFAYAGPITLDTLPDLFSHHRGNLAGVTMTAGTPEGGTGGDGDGAPAGGDGTPKPGDETGPKFTQADIDRAVQTRLADVTRKHEKALEDARADVTRTDTQRLELERDRAVEQGKAAATKAGEKVANALAQVAAIAAGGRADRAAAIVRQADLDGVAKFDGDDFTIDESRLSDAIGKVLTEYPEWKGDAAPDDKDKDADKDKPKPPAASGGDLNGGRTGELTLDEFKGMSMGERGKLAADEPDTYRKLADAEIDGNRKHTRR